MSIRVFAIYERRRSIGYWLVTAIPLLDKLSELLPTISDSLAVMVLAEGASVVTAATRIGRMLSALGHHRRLLARLPALTSVASIALELPPAIGQVIGLEGCLVVLDIQHSSRFGLML